MDRPVLVSITLGETVCPVGRLWSRARKGKESASFEYDATWLSHPERFALEPALTLGVGSYHTPPQKALFGALGDSAPDRWGRVLMRRAERRQAELEKRTPQTLLEVDYLLLVDDEMRQGALRFSEKIDGPFLSPAGKKRIPPLVELPKLLSATQHIMNDTESDEDLRLLLAPGSSLGGARPKAAVRDRDGQLVIAKFPQEGDEINIVAWEALALTLAKQAGILTAEWRIEKLANRSVLLLRRFDRHLNERIPFLSALSMLGANDNETHSYLEIADAIRQYGGHPEKDLRELWRRMLFNVLISNTDDHLRNHGFLYEWGKGWRLSPAYDMNPVPTDIKPRILSTAINLEDTTASLELLMDVAGYFRLSKQDATQIIKQVSTVVTKWRAEAARLDLSPSEVERMASAFEHEDLKKCFKL